MGIDFIAVGGYGFKWDDGIDFWLVDSLVNQGWSRADIEDSYTESLIDTAGNFPSGFIHGEYGEFDDMTGFYIVSKDHALDRDFTPLIKWLDNHKIPHEIKPYIIIEEHVS
jgi:hypothetical protein